jgi:hypothetical protein
MPTFVGMPVDHGFDRQLTDVAHQHQEGQGEDEISGRQRHCHRLDAARFSVKEVRNLDANLS